jgi:hypothetical protein
MTTGMQKKHEYVDNDAVAKEKLAAFSEAKAKSGVSPANKKKMADAVAGYMKNKSKVPSKASGMPPRGLAEREVQMGRLQDAKNLAAMMKRQRTGR